MDYDISISESSDFILIELNKPMTSDLGRHCGGQAAQLGEEQNIKKYLFTHDRHPTFKRSSIITTLRIETWPTLIFPETLVPLC